MPDPGNDPAAEPAPAPIQEYAERFRERIIKHLVFARGWSSRESAEAIDTHQEPFKAGLAAYLHSSDGGEAEIKTTAEQIETAARAARRPLRNDVSSTPPPPPTIHEPDPGETK